MGRRSSRPERPEYCRPGHRHISPHTTARRSIPAIDRIRISRTARLEKTARARDPSENLISTTLPHQVDESTSTVDAERSPVPASEVPTDPSASFSSRRTQLHVALFCCLAAIAAVLVYGIEPFYRQNGVDPSCTPATASTWTTSSRGRYTYYSVPSGSWPLRAANRTCRSALRILPVALAADGGTLRVGHDLGQAHSRLPVRRPGMRHHPAESGDAPSGDDDLFGHRWCPVRGRGHGPVAPSGQRTGTHHVHPGRWRPDRVDDQLQPGHRTASRCPCSPGSSFVS